MHYIETCADATYLKNAVVKCLNDNGGLETRIISKHLPGHRNFYDVPAKESKFYKKAMENGLDIKQGKIGMGMIYTMELKELYKIGMELIEKDTNIMLCDDKNCSFCSIFRKHK